MKIGFLCPANYALTGTANGVRVQALHQAAALRRAGHEVVLMDPWAAYDLATFDVVQFFSGGFPHLWIEGRPPALRHLAFAPIIDSNEPNWRYRLAGRLGHAVPKVYTVPAVLQDQARGSDLVICRSEWERRRVLDGLGVDPTKVGVEIVLNGVDPPPPTDPAEARGRLGLPAEFVLHASTYAADRKNAVRMVEAVGPTGLPLVLVGREDAGPTLGRLRALAKRYPTVRLLGFQDRATLDALFAACKVFCLPSEHEGTGLAALEAASHGAGVVITKHGGPPDYFGELGYYVDPASVGEIRRAVLAAWQEPRGDALRAHVRARLSWDASVRSLVAAYEKHLGGRSSAKSM